MTLIRKIRASFAKQLMVWVASIVVVISAVVILLLAQFSKEAILDESVETTQQILENAVLSVDNTLQLSKMSAKFEKRAISVDSSMIDHLIQRNNIVQKIRQNLPNARLIISQKTPDRQQHHQLSAPTGVLFAHFSFNCDAHDKHHYDIIDDNGQKSYLFHAPLSNADYVLAAICPVNDINSKYRLMQKNLSIRGGVGILLLLCLLYFLIDRQLKPLHRLANAAQDIAKGNLDTPIPDTHRQDETGRLQNSLSKMQRSLKSYMDVMQRKQTTMSHQNEELKAANAEVQEYERMRAHVLRDLTAQMAAPVNRIFQQTSDISHHYTTMTMTEMTHHQLSIMQDTETITRLLDLLMDDPHDAVLNDTKTKNAVVNDTKTVNAVLDNTKTVDAVLNDTKTKNAVVDDTKTVDAVLDDTKTATTDSATTT